MDLSKLPNSLTVDIPLDEHDGYILKYKLPNTLRVPRDMILSVSVTNCILPATTSTITHPSFPDYRYHWKLVELDHVNHRFETEFPEHALVGNFSYVSDVWQQILHMDTKITIAQNAGGLVCRKQDVSLSPSSCLEAEYRNGLVTFKHDGGNRHLDKEYDRQLVVYFRFDLYCTPELVTLLTGKNIHPVPFLMHNRDDPLQIYPDSLLEQKVDFAPLIQHIYMENLERGMVNGTLSSILLSRLPNESVMAYPKKHFKILKPQYDTGTHFCWDELRFYVETGDGTNLRFDKGVLHLVLELLWTRSGRTLREPVLWKDVLSCGGAPWSTRKTKTTR